MCVLIAHSEITELPKILGKSFMLKAKNHTF